MFLISPGFVSGFINMAKSRSLSGIACPLAQEFTTNNKPPSIISL
jgi:hypothetical protein